MILERENTEKINENLFECPFCSCTFATKIDLNSNLQAWGSDKREHVRQLDEAHREIDRSFKGTMAKRKGKKVSNLKSEWS